MKDPSILIVEDNAVIALLLQEFLTKNGYEIPFPVASGEDAIDYLKNFSIPDLILMDITLDGNIDGIEAAREIRKISDVPVIFLSAHPDEEQLSGGDVVTHSGYITKPFFLNDVLALIGKTLSRQ